MDRQYIISQNCGWIKKSDIKISKHKKKSGARINHKNAIPWTILQRRLRARTLILLIDNQAFYLLN